MKFTIKNICWVLFLSCIKVFSQTNCSDFKINDFKINGNTTVANNVATLTQAIGSQGGSIWSNKKIDLSEDFVISTELNFGTIDGGGADGIAFVLQPLASDLGVSGGGLGYQGISPSLGVEFDTWFNGGVDPLPQDHIAIIKNGHPESITAHSEFIPSIALPNIEDGLWHTAVFEWNASTKKLKLTFDNIIRFDISIDIINTVFSGNKIVYWGFTAATGAAVNIQKVKLKNYCVTLETCSNIPEITSSNTTICLNQSVQLGIEYTPPTICNMNITPSNIPLGNPIPGFTYKGMYNGHFYYVYNTPTSWTSGELICRQNGGYLVCINDINENQFVSNLTNNNIWIGLFRDPITCQFRWLDCMDITFTNWRPGEPNSEPCGEPYTQIIRGCSFGLNTWNNLDNTSSNGSCYSDMVPIMEIDPSIYNTAQINSTTTYLWSTGETTSSIRTTPLVTTTYWVDITTNGVTCRKNITITVTDTPSPTGVSNQQFCNDKTIDNLVINGTDIKWYPSVVSTTSLNGNTPLVTGTSYFASQTINGCESTNRFQVTAVIVKIPTPTGEVIQKFCEEENPVISSFKVSGNGVLWYDSLSNGSLIENKTKLEDNATYFATTLDNVSGCESVQRLSVKANIIKCKVVAYNLIVINGNSLNDKLLFDEIAYFPDNSVKIFNRYGKLVWETTGYNNSTNAFKGKSNVIGVYSKESYLPSGTYFYVLVYDNNLLEKCTELTGYLQIDNEQ